MPPHTPGTSWRATAKKMIDYSANHFAAGQPVTGLWIT